MKNQLLKNVSGVLHTEGLLLRLCFVLYCLLSVSDISAQSAQKRISIQGTLKKANGSPLDDGYYRVTFKLYGALTGGSALWQEITDSVEVSGGIYSHALGSKTSLTTSTFMSTVYLGVQVGSYEMTPRTEITYAPYAFAVYSAVCSGAVGDVKFSILNPAQFKKANGDCWVPLDGRTLTTEELATTYNIKNLPNAGGYFLRAQEFGSSYTSGTTMVTTTPSGDIDAGRTSTTSIATVQSDANKSHNHTASTGSAGSHTHGSNAPGGDNKFGLASSQPGNNTVTGSTDDTDDQLDILAGPKALVINAVGDHTHTVTVQSDGGTESRPNNLNFYIYIRVN
jgi:hypothetical protein